jgi:type II secretory pathway pseudopilin PulG
MKRIGGRGAAPRGSDRRRVAWWARLRKRSDEGFILLETIIALSVITIIMGAVGAEFVGAMASTTKQRSEQVAVQISDSEAERVRSLHASDLVTGRDAASVAAQFASAPTAVQPWLSTMNQISDSKATTGSGKTATLPTSASSAAPSSLQKPDNTTYTVLDYLGSCYIASGGTDCGKSKTAGSIPYMRDVIAVTWNGDGCDSTPCAYVTTTLLSATSDQTFQVNQQLPPAPTLTDLNETVAVGDTLTVDDGTAIQLAVDDGKGVPPFTWALKTGSTLPTNLAMSPTGLISSTGSIGAPSGTINTQVVVTDAFLRSATMTIHWTVEPQLQVTSTNPQSGLYKVALSPTVTLAASGGDGAPYKWSDPGSTLPPGLTLSSGGVVSGTPTATGVYNVSVQVVDKGGKRSAIGFFTWTVTYPPVAASNPGTQTNTINTAISPLTLSTSGGDGNFQWSDPTGSLPAGLTMTSAGVISGTPTTLQNYNVSLQVTDPTAGTTSDYTKTVSFTWKVVTAPTVTAPANQTSSVGSPITGSRAITLTTNCPNSPCTYALNNKAPGGLTVSNTGVISGTISGASGSYTGITVTVTDRQGVTATSATFTWTVNPAPALSSPGSQNTPRQTAVSLDMSTRASGGTGAYTYSQSGLPSGLSINSSTGKITGTTANVNSVSSVTVTITDSTGATSSTTFNWYVSNLAISVPNQTTYKSVSRSIDLDNYTTGGNGSYTYTVTGLPSWLTYNSSTHVISGTSPTTASSPSIGVKVVDANGATVNGSFTWTAITTTTLTMSNISNQTSNRGNADSLTVSASGGTSPYTYSINKLPAGLSLNTSSGLISGTPSSRGTTSGIIVTVTDSTGATATSNSFSWTVS